MKLLTIVVPCYHSQDYMEKAITSLLPGGEETEILIVNDGSTDRTGEIADDYARRYPDIIRAIHQENGGHGDAVMTGLRNATGLYFKVVDSDDWVDAEAYRKILDTLRAHSNDTIDMLVSNYVYEKAGARHKHVMRYRRTLPQDCVFGWEETKPFRDGHYMLMHSVIFRTQLLRDCGLDLPKHTFYVDELFVYCPLPLVEKMIYLDVDFYRYFIGREGQSVQENVMIQRIDQALKVNRLLISSVDPFSVQERRKRAYMLHFLEIVTAINSTLLTISGTEENRQKKEELWAYLKKENPRTYQTLHRRLAGKVLQMNGKPVKMFLLGFYKTMQKIVGFN